MNYTPKNIIAQQFFPDLKESSAVKALGKELKSTPGLLDALLHAGYQPRKKLFSPKQIDILYTFLGEP